MKLHVYQDRARRWRWRVRHRNGRILADSGQGYARRRDCLHGAETALGVSLVHGGKAGALTGELWGGWRPLVRLSREGAS